MKLIVVLEEYCEAVASQERSLSHTVIDQNAIMSVSVIEMMLALIETLLDIGILRPTDFMSINIFEHLERSLTIMKNQHV